MNIAFLSTVHGHQWPGSEYLWSACAEKLLQMRHQVVVSASADLRGSQELQKLQSAGASIHLVSPTSGRVKRIQQRLWNPFRYFSRKCVDLLVVSSGSAYDPAYNPLLGQFLRTTDIPFVFICHFNAETFWVDDKMREAMAVIFQKAKTTVFVSRENQRLTERQLAIPIPRVVIIAPPLCLKPTEPLPWPEQDLNTPWRFACVARLEPRWKGQDVLLEVLSSPEWKKRDYRLSLFGQGAEEKYLRQLSRFYGLEKKIAFAGFSNPTAIWREHHLQVLATRGEGGPMVITEGMMCGRAAVTTRCGFNSDYVLDGVTGFLADFATPECFGTKLEEAWNRRQDWKTMGINAYQSIRKKKTHFDAPERLLNLLLNEAG